MKNEVQRGKVILMAIFMLVGSVRSSVVLYDFESQDLSGWTTTGDAWDVGGTTGTSPNISPADGSLFARSGAPNQISGTLSETKVGSVMSVAHSLTYDTLEWLSTGWSGNGLTGSGVNKFEILDGSLAVKAQISTAQSDSWKTEGVDMLSLGFSAGEPFYFRAVDGANAQNYSWMAFDKLTLTGTAIPDPATTVLIGGGGLGLLFCRRLFSL